MPDRNLPILVVDDAKISNAMISKTLSSAGFRDLRQASGAGKAMQMLEERQVSVLLADWLMPGIDGLEMTERVRQLDEATNHFTYIILLTAKEGGNTLMEAFDRGIDDFIHKAHMTSQLLPRIYAAERTATMQNTLLAANQFLLTSNQQLTTDSELDRNTGLGNQKRARSSLESMLKQVENRGGAANYLLVGLKNWTAIKSSHDSKIVNELALGIARRLSHLIRPLDTLCRIAEDQFVVISNFTAIEECSPACFKRFHDGINYTAFKTSTGFISVQASISSCAADNSAKTPDAQQLEKITLKKLQQAHISGTPEINWWPGLLAE